MKSAMLAFGQIFDTDAIAFVEEELLLCRGHVGEHLLARVE